MVILFLTHLILFKQVTFNISFLLFGEIGILALQKKILELIVLYYIYIILIQIKD